MVLSPKGGAGGRDNRGMAAGRSHRSIDPLPYPSPGPVQRPPSVGWRGARLWPKLNKSRHQNYLIRPPYNGLANYCFDTELTASLCCTPRRTGAFLPHSGRVLSIPQGPEPRTGHPAVSSGRIASASFGRPTTRKPARDCVVLEPAKGDKVTGLRRDPSPRRHSHPVER